MDDAAQRVFARVLAQGDRIQPGSERAYLMRAAFRAALEQQRAKKRWLARASEVEVDDTSSQILPPDQTLAQREELALLDRALAELPRELRAALTLFELEGAHIQRNRGSARAAAGHGRLARTPSTRAVHPGGSPALSRSHAMTFDDELARWSDDDADDLVAKLLRAGRADGPSARALRAAPTAVAALISTSSAAAAGLAPAGGVVSALATRASPLVLLKWVAVGSLSGASIMALVHAPNLMPAAPAVAASVMASPRPQVVPSRALPSVAVATQVAPPETANASPEPRASVQQADVAREVALLDAARAALVAGNVPKALRLLDALQRLPQRALGPEATVLRVRVLLARGERSEAQRVADAFYLQAGGSPQAGVLRSLLAQSVIQPSPPRL